MPEQSYSTSLITSFIGKTTWEEALEQRSRLATNTVNSNTVSNRSRIQKAESSDMNAPFIRQRGTERLTDRKRWTKIIQCSLRETKLLLNGTFPCAYCPSAFKNDSVENHVKSKNRLQKCKKVLTTKLRQQSLKSAIVKSMEYHG